MSSKSVAQLFYGDKTAICEFCGEEYTIKESDAWNMATHCSGECEALGEESEDEL